MEILFVTTVDNVVNRLQGILLLICKFTFPTGLALGIEVRVDTGSFDVFLFASWKPSKNRYRIRMRAHHSKGAGQTVDQVSFCSAAGQAVGAKPNGLTMCHMKPRQPLLGSSPGRRSSPALLPAKVAHGPLGIA